MEIDGFDAMLFSSLASFCPESRSTAPLFGLCTPHAQIFNGILIPLKQRPRKTAVLGSQSASRIAYRRPKRKYTAQEKFVLLHLHKIAAYYVALFRHFMTELAQETLPELEFR